MDLCLAKIPQLFELFFDCLKLVSQKLRKLSAIFLRKLWDICNAFVMLGQELLDFFKTETGNRLVGIMIAAIKLIFFVYGRKNSSQYEENVQQVGLKFIVNYKKIKHKFTFKS
jgi:hypothetical protein